MSYCRIQTAIRGRPFPAVFTRCNPGMRIIEQPAVPCLGYSAPRPQYLPYPRMYAPYRRSNWRSSPCSPHLHYQRLCEQDLQAAIAIANAVFARDADAETGPASNFRAGLHPEQHRDDLARLGIGSLSHWTVKEDGKIVGLTGLYRMTCDPPDAIWLDWFCTAPEAGGRGIGRKMLQWTVTQAVRQGYGRLCLWTTDDPHEAVAQHLYDTMGFKIVSEEPSEDGTLKTYRREKTLPKRRPASQPSLL